MIETRSLDASTLRARESRRLLAWALERGADEFSISVMAMQGVDAPHADAFEDALAPWESASASRRVLYGGDADGRERRREVRLWRLTPISLALLEEFLPDGLFTYDTRERGWFEDPLVYRRGELLLGVITHEREGVILVTPEEAANLAALGVPSGAAT